MSNQKTTTNADINDAGVSESEEVMMHKHDLSFNHATLDLTELDWALRHGLGMARRECERALADNQSACWDGKCSDIKSSAERLQEAATSLFTIAQTLYYVDGSHERQNITFVRGRKHEDDQHLKSSKRYAHT